MRDIRFRTWDKKYKTFRYSYDYFVVYNNRPCVYEYGDLLGCTYWGVL